MNQENIVIVAASRTPLGSMLGNLSSLTAPELGAIANEAAIKQSGLSDSAIDEVISGCVLQAGLGQAAARQAAIKAGVPNNVPATTINKMCGSGMQSVMMAFDAIRAGSSKIVMAGGLESMSNAPYLLDKTRAGMRLGHGEIKDSMFIDGLEDAYDKGQLMGVFAERTAVKYGFTRDQQDEFAINSLKKALSAIERNAFDSEISPVTIKTRKGEHTIKTDEGPDPSKLEKIARLKPAFAKDGTVTAANSSSISDGAASLIVMSETEAKKHGCEILATIKAHSRFAQAPEWFTTAPVTAIKRVLAKADWSIDEIDLFEINEAFAVVTMAAIQDLKLDAEKVNVNGGACALGHPIGASGARIIVTLIHALRARGLSKGVAALCIGGGEATAIALEM